MDKKIQKSFGKVKADYLRLSNEILNVHSELKKVSKQIELTGDVKIQIKKLEKINLESFVINMENEFKSINELIKTFNKRFTDTSKFMENFHRQLENYHIEIVDLKNKFHSTQNRAENTNLDVEVTNERLGEFQELINEKIDIQISSLRLEMIEEISNIYDRMALNSPSKIEKNMNYDKPKESFSSKFKKPKKSKIKNNEHKENKIKKAVKWLFVDDDNDETLDSVKDEVKKGDI